MFGASEGKRELENEHENEADELTRRRGQGDTRNGVKRCGVVRGRGGDKERRMARRRVSERESSSVGGV